MSEDGLTLLEVLVALALLSVILAFSLAAYGDGLGALDGVTWRHHQHLLLENAQALYIAGLDPQASLAEVRIETLGEERFIIVPGLTRHHLPYPAYRGVEP